MGNCQCITTLDQINIQRRKSIVLSATVDPQTVTKSLQINKENNEINLLDSFLNLSSQQEILSENLPIIDVIQQSIIKTLNVVNRRKLFLNDLQETQNGSEGGLIKIILNGDEDLAQTQFVTRTNKTSGYLGTIIFDSQIDENKKGILKYKQNKTQNQTQELPSPQSQKSVRFNCVAEFHVPPKFTLKRTTIYSQFTSLDIELQLMQEQIQSIISEGNDDYTFTF